MLGNDRIISDSYDKKYLLKLWIENPQELTPLLMINFSLLKLYMENPQQLISLFYN